MIGSALMLLALPATQTAPPDEKVTPGLAGFAVVFLLALATVVLMRSMVKHLRVVRYSEPPPGPADGPDPSVAPDDRRQ